MPHGALLQLQEPVREGQKLSVRHVTTGEEIPCTVVDLSPGANGVAEVGVQFAQAKSALLAGVFSAGGLERAGPGSKNVSHLAQTSAPPSPQPKDPIPRK